VAIAIAKARHEVLIAIPDKKRRRRLTVLNELADFNRLATALKEFGRPVRVVITSSLMGSSPTESYILHNLSVSQGCRFPHRKNINIDCH